MPNNRINIVTSVCIDTDKLGSSVNYPSLGLKSKIEKREIYWRCVVTFCLTSLKFNNDKNHIVYTNDIEDIVIGNYNVKNELKKLGVNFVELPFENYDPKQYSKRFRNAFYKLEVINELSSLDNPSILLDTDCIWTKSDSELFKILESGQLLLQNNRGTLNKPSPITKEMSDLYTQIPINKVNKDFPVWYGGELIGGSPKHFKKIAKDILETIQYSKKQIDLGNSMSFSDGYSILDNDEFISSYVYNSCNFDIFDTNNKFSKRIWTKHKANNVDKKDLDIAIWHLPAEKSTGLKKLFCEIVNNLSRFWATDIKSSYLGSFVGIPKRN